MTNAVGKQRRVRKIDPNGNIYYDVGMSDLIYDPERNVTVKVDIDELRKGMKIALKYVDDNPKGLDGLSAYDIAVEEGFEGTKEEWLISLHGENGEDGLSAYELAKLYEGFIGTVNEWLNSLKGEKGDKGPSDYELAVNNGLFEGTEEEWLDRNTVTRITEEEIDEIYKRLVAGYQAGDIESDVLDTVIALNERVDAMDIAMGDMIINIAMNRETGELTATKYNGNEIVETIIVNASDDDINKVLAGFLLDEETENNLIGLDSEGEIYDTQSSFLKDDVEGGE